MALILSDGFASVCGGIQALAFVRWKQSRFREALPLFHEMENHLGKSAALCENIAHTYNSLGEFEKAEDYLRQALKFIEQEHGLNKAIWSLGNWGLSIPDLSLDMTFAWSSIDRLGKQKEALPVCRKAYEFYKERANGAPASLQAKAGISCAKIHAKLGQLKDAEAYIREAVEMYEVTCGETSPLTASAYHELGKVLWAQRRREDAQKALIRGVQERRPSRLSTARLMVLMDAPEPSIRQSRPPERLSAEVRDLDTRAVGGPPSFVWGTLCPDLTYCPQGRTYELKPKLGVEDCLLPECQSLSRFTLLQCIDYPKKKRSISRYNPSAFFRAIFAGDGAAVSEQLRHLRRTCFWASADPRQNNFRVLGGNACDASDTELEDLKEVLLRAGGVFAKLRAFGLLAAGAAVEGAAQDSRGTPVGREVCIMHASKAKHQNFQARKYERPGLKQDEIEEIKEAFDLFDTDQSGEIDLRELKAAMQSLGYESKNDTIFTMLAELDKDGNASLDFDEFLDLMSGKEGREEKDTKEEIDKIFKLFDEGNKGHIDVKDVQKVCKELGERLTNEEITEIVRRACQDESKGEITAEDFYLVMTKKTFP
eukprot:s104_g25.t1